MNDLRVAYIIDDTKIVLNRGSEDGIKTGQRFLIYGLSKDDIIDPVTHKSLGKLELVRGRGVVEYVQDKMCIVKAESMSETLSELLGSTIPPFSNPQIGDYAKQINV